MNRLGAAVLHQSAVRRNEHPSEARIGSPEPELEPGLAPKWLAIPVAHDHLRSNRCKQQRGRDPPAARGERLSRLRAGPASDFFFNDTPTTEIYTLSLRDALPI